MLGWRRSCLLIIVALYFVVVLGSAMQVVIGVFAVGPWSLFEVGDKLRARCQLLNVSET